MQQKDIKHILVEKYLNEVKFNGIRIGSLIAYYYALNFMSKQHSRLIFTNLLVLFKYVLTLWNNKKTKPFKADFLFTKITNRFHFNALMDPLIRYYYSKSIIVCDEHSFDKSKFNIQNIQRRAITFEQASSNYSKDACKILRTLFTAFYLLIKNRKRLRLSFPEVVYFVNNLFFQLRRASFWDHYFYIAETKPLCVVTEFDRYYETAPLVLAARKHKILTITLIHGIIDDYSITPFLADYIFCWGESQKSQLIARNVDPERIFITGNPIFDFTGQDGYSDDRASKGITVCLGISPGFDNRLLIEPFKSALNHIENARGIVKLHPSLSKDNYKWIETISSKIEVLTSPIISNSELFKKIDLLIINYSGMANEGLAAGVPVVLLVPDCINQLNNFQNELILVAGCRLATNIMELVNVFNEIAANPVQFKSNAKEKSKKYLKMLYNMTGKDSVNAMIAQIDKISIGELNISE